MPGTTRRCSRPDGSSRSLLTQTLIIHMIRTAKIPFIESRASPPLMATSLIIAAIGIALPFTLAWRHLGFCPAAADSIGSRFVLILVSYAVLTHLMKTWFRRRFGLS